MPQQNERKPEFSLITNFKYLSENQKKQFMSAKTFFGKRIPLLNWLLNRKAMEGFEKAESLSKRILRLNPNLSERIPKFMAISSGDKLLAFVIYTEKGNNRNIAQVYNFPSREGVEFKHKFEMTPAMYLLADMVKHGANEFRATILTRKRPKGPMAGRDFMDRTIQMGLMEERERTLHFNNFSVTPKGKNLARKLRPL